MSAIPGSFIECVQERKIAGPSSENFTLSDWDAAYEQCIKANGDDVVYQAGRIVGEKLKDLWACIAQTGLDRHPRSKAMRYVTACANRAFLQARSLLSNAMKGDTPLPMASPGHLRLEYAANDTATYDGLLTASIDVWGRMLKHIASHSGKGLTQRGSLEDDVHAALPFFSSIHSLEFLWNRVVWQGWRLSEEGGTMAFQPPSVDPVGASYAVSESRRDLEDGEFAIVFNEAWSAGASLPPVLQARAVRIEPDVSFELEMRQSGHSKMPATLPSRERLEASELAMVLDDTLAKEGVEFSLRDLLDAWEILSSASASIARQFLDSKTDPLALSIHYSKIENLLHVLEWDGTKRRSVIDFLTFFPDAVDGLWSNPFVLLDDGSLLPALACVAEPNLYRLCEQWLSSAKANDVLRSRGDRFEKQMRERCKAEIPPVGAGEDIFIVIENWKPAVEDIDLAFRVGNTIFMAELKFKKFPSLAVEIGRYVDELQHAANQLDKRLAFFDQNKKAAAQKTRYRGQAGDLQVFGFILTATQFGAGLKMNGHPVIDADLFFEFFRLGHFFALMEPQTLSNPETWDTPHKLSLRTDRGIREDLIRHLQNPLRIRWMEYGTREYVRSVALNTSRSGRLTWVETAVDTSVLIGDLGIEKFGKLSELNAELLAELV